MVNAVRNSDIVTLKEFKDKKFVKLDGSAVCTSCHDAYLKAVSSKCKKCKKPITDTVVRFKNEECELI